MQNLYTIETKPSGDLPFSRSAALQTFKKAHFGGQSTGAFIREVQKHGLPFSVGNLQTVVRQMRERFRMEMGKQAHPSARYMVRVFQGRIIRVRIHPDGGLSEARNEIVNTIRRERHYIKEKNDHLTERGVGYYLKKYQHSVLNKAKRPTSDMQFTGIEIECVMPSGADMSKLLPFAKWVNTGHDGSIDAGDGETGNEIRVCVEKSEVRNVVPKIVETLKEMGAYVNRSCGLHVHLDQRQAIDPALSFQKLVRSLGLLYTVVPASRRKNTYCKRNRHANFDVARGRGRYKAINATAYDRYKTIEVRLFGGTLEAEKIVNWIETLWAIVGGEIVMRCPKNFDTARRHWQALTDENVAWLKARQAKFADLNTIAPDAEADVDEVQAIRAERDEENEAYCGHCDTSDHDADDCGCDCGGVGCISEAA